MLINVKTSIYILYYIRIIDYLFGLMSLCSQLLIHTEQQDDREII